MSLLGKLKRHEKSTENQSNKPSEHIKASAWPHDEPDRVSLKELTGPVKEREPQAPTTQIVMARRNGEPKPNPSWEVLTIGKCSDDIDTIIIRYPEPELLGSLKHDVAQWAHKNSTSYINGFIDVDIFVNISLDPDIVNPNVYRGKKWLRVAYELTKNNQTLSAVNRFPQCLVVEIRRTFDKPKMTLDMLFGRC